MFTAYHIFAYILIIATILLQKTKKQIVPFWILVAILVFFTGVREPGNYADLSNYQRYYETGEQTDYGFGFGSVNLGYEILNTVLRLLGFPFQFFLFVVAFYIYVSYAKFIVKYSPYILLSLTLLFFTGYMFSLIILRQFIAVCIGLTSFKYVIKRNQLKFLLTVVVAILFHSTGAILLPVYYLYGIKINKRNILLLLGAFVTISALFAIVANYLASFSAYYSNYIGRETEASLVRTIMKLYIMIVFVLALRKSVFDKNINFLLLICLAFNVVLYMGGNAIYGLYRLRTYFEISEIIGIPIILYYIRGFATFHKLCFRILVFIYMVLLFISFDRMVYNDEILYDRVYSWCF